MVLSLEKGATAFGAAIGIERRVLGANRTALRSESERSTSCSSAPVPFTIDLAHADSIHGRSFVILIRWSTSSVNRRRLSSSNQSNDLSLHEKFRRNLSSTSVFSTENRTWITTFEITVVRAMDSSIELFSWQHVSDSRSVEEHLVEWTRPLDGVRSHLSRKHLLWIHHQN